MRALLLLSLLVLPAVTRGQTALSPPQPPVAAPFTDVTAASHPRHFFEVDTLCASRVSNGCSPSPSLYCPGATMTRQEMAKFLILALVERGTVAVDAQRRFTYRTTSYFNDVGPGNPFFPYIQKLRETQITLGCGNGANYCPTDPVFNWQMALFTARAMDMPSYPSVPAREGPNWPGSEYYDDVPYGTPWFGYIQRMGEDPIIPTDDFFAADAATTRAHAAYFLVRGILRRFPPPDPGPSVPVFNIDVGIPTHDPLTDVVESTATVSQTAGPTVQDFSVFLAMRHIASGRRTEQECYATYGCYSWISARDHLDNTQAGAYEADGQVVVGGFTSARESQVGYVATPAPTLSGIHPSSGLLNSTFSATLGGRNLNYSPQVTSTCAGLSFQPTGLVYGGLTVTVTIAANAQTGNCPVTVCTSGGQVGTSLLVGDPSPVITSVSPADFDPGTAVAVVIEGTGFGARPTVAVSGTGITVGTPSVSTTGSGQRINVLFTVSPNAAPGPRDLVVTSNGAAGTSFQPASGSVSQARVSVRVSPLTSVSQVAKFDGQTVPVLYLSTGDTSGRVITTSVTPGTARFSVVYNVLPLSNPDSDCAATLAVPDGSAVGFVNSPVDAGNPGCSGIFQVRANANGYDSSNVSSVVVPPQVLIKMLWGEANAQNQPGDMSQLAIGKAVRQRFGDSGYFPGVNTWQQAITPGQFRGLARATNIDAGPTLELKNAAELFAGLTAVDVDRAQCFLTPTPREWQQLETALQSHAIGIPILADGNDPGCYPSARRQFIRKRSIGTHYSGNGTPAFILVQERDPAEPAVIEID